MGDKEGTSVAQRISRFFCCSVIFFSVFSVVYSLFVFTRTFAYICISCVHASVIALFRREQTNIDTAFRTIEHEMPTEELDSKGTHKTCHNK